MKNFIKLNHLHLNQVNSNKHFIYDKSSVIRRIKEKFLMPFLVLFFSFISLVPTFATTIIVSANTNWSALTGGTGGGLPTADDTVIVRTRAILTVNVADAVCETIILGQAGANNSGGLVFNNGSQLTVSGTLSIGNTGNRVSSLVMTNGGKLITTGLIVVNSGNSSFTPGTGTIQISATHTLPALIFTSFYNLIVDGSAIQVSLGRVTTISNILTIANGTLNDAGFQMTSTGTLNMTSGTLNLGSAAAATTLPAFASRNYSSGTTVAFVSDVAQTVAATSYPNLTFSGAGSKTTAAGTLSIAENWNTGGGDAVLNTNNSNISVTGNISGSGNITSGSGTISIAGNWSNNGTFTANTGTVSYVGASQTLAPLSYYNLTCNPISGGISLSGNTNVSNVLTITTSTLNLLTHNLILDDAATILITSPSSTKMILASSSGKLRKSFSGNGSFTFPIGDNTLTPEYTPVTIDVTGSAYAPGAYVEVNVTDDKHPNNASTNHFISRYWNITQSGITGATVNVTGTYVTADINGTEGSASASQLNGTFNQTTNPWIKFTALASNTLTASGASLTDGQVSAFTGITGANPTAVVSGGNVTVCPNAPVGLSTNVTGDGAFIYSWSPTGGLSSSTVADPTVTVAATTIYTVTVFDGNGITATDNTTITIDPGPLAIMPGGITGNIITCDGATGVQYSVQPATNAVSYSWSLPAGASQASGGSTRIITVDFPNPYTTGTVCVVSENACAIPSAIRCLTVRNVTAFTPGRILGSANVCLNATGLVYSTDAVNGATSYNWSLPAGMLITAGAGTRSITVDAGPSVTPGPLCVSVSNGCGTSNAKCINVTVSSNTLLGGITGATSICASTSGLIYSIQPVSGATSYTWTTPVGFNIVSGQNTRIITVDIGASPFSGDVCVTANFSCGASTPRCKAVSVNGVVPGSISGPANVCAGSSGVAYSIVALPNVISYNWTFPSGITQVSGGSTNAITVDISSNYTQGDICVTVTSVCGTSLPKCITVKDFSLVIPGGITGPNIVCQNSLGLNYSVQPVTGAVSYNWIVPPGIVIVSGQGTRFLTVNVDNSFTVGDIGVQAVSSCASQSIIRWNTKITTIVPGIPSTITASPAVCPSTTVTFSITALANASSYVWTLPQGMTFTVGPPVNTNSISVDVSSGFTQGSVCVRAVSSCNINGYMKCQNFTVVPGIPSAITGSSGVCPGAVGVAYSVPLVAGAVSYNWDLPSGWSITTGAGSNSITASVPVGFIQGQISVNTVNSCGIQGGLKILNVNYVPATPGTVSGSTAVCTGNTYIYSIAAVAGADSYTWTLPTGVSFTSGPPVNANSISVDIGGAFAGGQICVTASTSCGGPSLQRCLTIGTIPATPGAISGLSAVCQGATSLIYSIAAMPGITDYNWVAPAGISIISGQGTNSITVDIGGGFISGSLCVEAENACGNPGPSICLNISLTPDAPVSISLQDNFCPGATRTLTVSPVSGAVSYTWAMPAGLTLLSGQGNATITVAIDAGYVSGNVCVTPFTSCGNPGAQFCESITPNAAGDAVSITSSAIACSGSQVVFSIPVINGAGSFSWSVPVGLTILSGQGTPTITTSAGPGFTSGDVCVTASSGCGNDGSQYCQTFSTTPVTPGNITAPTSVCPNDPAVVFSVPAASGPASYLWTVPGDMTIVSGQGSNVIIASTGPGFVSGQVTVAAQSACSVQSGIKSINVGSSLGIPLNIAGPTYVCPSSAGVIFSVPQVIGAVSYNWILPPDMTITSGQNTNVITVSTGAIFPGGQLSVGAVSVCGIQSALRSLTLGFNIGQPGIISAPLSVCPNTSGVVISVPPLANAASYNWYLPAGITITAGNNTNSITVSAGPSFVGGQICVEAVSTCAVVGTQRCATLIYLPVQPGGITGLTKGVCGQTQQYSVQPTTGAANYTWTAPANASITSGQGTRIVQVTYTTAYVSGQLQVFASNSCGNSAIRTSAVITGAPDKPTIISGLNSVCANQTAVDYSVPPVFNTTSYTWSVPAGATVASGQGTENITVDWGTTAGNVSVTTTNTCGTSAATNLAVAITCRISSMVNPEMNLSVYPNPSSEDFIVKFDAVNSGKIQFNLEDLSGRVVIIKTEFVATGNNTIVFDVRNLPRGAYILNVNDEHKNLGYAKIILQ